MYLDFALFTQGAKEKDPGTISPTSVSNKLSFAYQSVFPVVFSGELALSAIHFTSHLSGSLLYNEVL